MGETKLSYPASRTVDVVDTVQGTKVPDPYRWLEDGESEEVKTWLKAQDDLARQELARLPERDKLAARLKEVLYRESMSSPMHRGSRYFYYRQHANQEKGQVCFREGLDGEEQVLLDPNTWSADGSVSLGSYSVSWDGKRVAYQVKANNSDEATLHVMEIDGRKVSDVDTIEGAKYADASWTPEGDGFYYTWLPTDPKIPASERPGYADVRYHKLGTDPKSDPVVREKTGDPTTFIGAGVSRDGHWLLLSITHGWDTSDVFFKDLRKKDAEWVPLAVGRKALYYPTAYKDRFYVSTNEGAPLWKIMLVDPAKPQRENWKEVVPERRESLEEFAIVGGHLALKYLKDVTSRLEVADLDGKRVREVKLPGLGTSSILGGQEDEDEAFYTFQSFTHPWEAFRTSVKTGETSLWFRLKIPVDPEPYTVTQVFFRSKDGTRVPMFIVHRKDLKKTGDTPVMLTGYGGFQASSTPYFSGAVYPWLERGGIYAVANLRGGSEYGEEWHQNGMLLKKQNVFDDFIAAAEYLVKERYTRPDRLAISGGSNGGLLVGAAEVQRPDLFGAVVCAVPLLDMVRYHLFGSGRTWIGEYGSSENPEQFKALYAYSPYHHVRAGTRYPATLMLSADSDDRVDPMHARKFAAALQTATTGGPVLLRVERNAGHGGADLIKATVERLADQYAFLLQYLGMNAG
ncbi:MAG TPA: prolyl oligopeptidase family serine peptidase [Armatimonadota bacterium]|jgi:prolyl oligopeptidase